MRNKNKIEKPAIQYPFLLKNSYISKGKTRYEPSCFSLFLLFEACVPPLLFL